MALAHKKEAFIQSLCKLGNHRLQNYLHEFLCSLDWNYVQNFQSLLDLSIIFHSPRNYGLKTKSKTLETREGSLMELGQKVAL